MYRDSPKDVQAQTLTIIPKVSRSLWNVMLPQPFCLVLASINSHAPWTGGDASVFDRKKLQLPPQFIDTEVTREYYARYLAEVGLLDQQVGDAMQILKEKNLLQNTLVIFISEQGTQFAGAKWTNWSAGVKSAMVASW